MWLLHSSSSALGCVQDLYLPLRVSSQLDFPQVFLVVATGQWYLKAVIMIYGFTFPK